MLTGERAMNTTMFQKICISAAVAAHNYGKDERDRMSWQDVPQDAVSAINTTTMLQNICIAAAMTRQNAPKKPRSHKILDAAAYAFVMSVFGLIVVGMGAVILSVFY
jgi:hypothetical protein